MLPAALLIVTALSATALSPQGYNWNLSGIWKGGYGFVLLHCTPNKCCPSRFTCCKGYHSSNPTHYCCENGMRKIQALAC